MAHLKKDAPERRMDSGRAQKVVSHCGAAGVWKSV
jgi:hypothetical protein